MITSLRIIIRLLFSWLFLRAGLDVLRNPEPRATTASWLLDTIDSVVPTDHVLMVRINASVHVGAAILLGLGIMPRLAALALASSLVPTTLGGHAFWRHDDPAHRSMQQVHFNKNLAILAGLLLIVLDDAR
jgi:putative oxidoreductase